MRHTIAKSHLQRFLNRAIGLGMQSSHVHTWHAEFSVPRLHVCFRCDNCGCIWEVESGQCVNLRALSFENHPVVHLQ